MLSNTCKLKSSSSSTTTTMLYRPTATFTAATKRSKIPWTWCFLITQFLITQQFLISALVLTTTTSQGGVAATILNNQLLLPKSTYETDDKQNLGLKLIHGIYKRQINENEAAIHRDKLKEMSPDNEKKSFNDKVRALRKDQILREVDEEYNQLQNRDRVKTNYAEWEKNEKKMFELEVEKGKSDVEKAIKFKSVHFWTVLICTAVAVIVILIAIIITLAINNRRYTLEEASQVPNLEAPKIVVEENVYTTTTEVKNQSPPAATTTNANSNDVEIATVTDALLPQERSPNSTLVYPNPIRQPNAPFTYSPIPVRNDSSNSG